MFVTIQLQACKTKSAILAYYIRKDMNKEHSMYDLKDAAKHMDVLFCEDDETLSSVQVKFLERYFNSVTACADGEEALDAYIAGNFDIVITDLQMPKLNGDLLCKQIKEINDDQAIIVMSAFSEQNFEGLKNLSINAFLEKPLFGNKFLETLTNVVRFVENKKISDAAINEYFDSDFADNGHDAGHKKETLKEPWHRLDAKQYDLILSEQEKCHIADLAQAEEALRQSITEISLGVTKTTLLTIKSRLEMYAKIIDKLSEFQDFAYSLFCLASVLGETLDFSNEVDKSQLYLMLNAFLKDLRVWRESIFENKTASFIHYMDDSLMCSCDCVKQALLHRERKDEESDILLF